MKITYAFVIAIFAFATPVASARAIKDAKITELTTQLRTQGESYTYLRLENDPELYLVAQWRSDAVYSAVLQAKLHGARITLVVADGQADAMCPLDFAESWESPKRCKVTQVLATVL